MGGAVLGDLSPQPLDDARLRVVGVDEHRELCGVLTDHAVPLDLSMQVTDRDISCSIVCSAVGFSS